MNAGLKLRCPVCGNEAEQPRAEVDSTKGGAHIYITVGCDNGHPVHEMGRVSPSAAGDVLTTGPGGPR